MFLSASKYVGDWDHNHPEERKAYSAITKTLGLDGFRCEGSPNLTVQVKVAYWRKANTIHAWFVEKIQEGRDECQESYVKREQLEELVADCKKVLGYVETLPARSGFFVGSTDYDEYYLEDLKDTIAQLRAVLDNPALKDWSFHYKASW